VGRICPAAGTLRGDGLDPPQLYALAEKVRADEAPSVLYSEVLGWFNASR
jgi:hypothetical protein